MALQIIGAGMGRTGTESMRTALEMLGYAPCHHMFALRDNADLVPPWMDVVCNGATPDWDALFDEFKAQLDWPGMLYWRELAAHYPDARVILTTRDPKAWYQSLIETIVPFVAMEGMHNPPHRNDIARMMRTVFETHMGWDADDPEYIKDLYRTHVEEVQATIPADRLLVFPVGSGWEPLCEFLDLPVPEGPFPSGNTTKDFKQRIAANLNPD